MTALEGDRRRPQLSCHGVSFQRARKAVGPTRRVRWPRRQTSQRRTLVLNLIPDIDRFEVALSRAPAFPQSLSNILILLSAPSPRNVADIVRIRSSNLKLSRTTLKRPIPSFSVEIRKRPGRTADPGVNTRLFETKAPLSEFDRDSHRAAAAIFAPRSDVVAPILAPKSAPAGRVLPVLVVDQPLNTESRDELSPTTNIEQSSQAADRPPPRSREGGASPSKLLIHSAPSPTARLSVASNRPVSSVDNSRQPTTDDGVKASEQKPLSKISGNAKRASARPTHASGPAVQQQTNRLDGGTAHATIRGPKPSLRFR